MLMLLLYTAPKWRKFRSASGCWSGPNIITMHNTLVHWYNLQWSKSHSYKTKTYSFITKFTSLSFVQSGKNKNNFANAITNITFPKLQLSLSHVERCQTHLCPGLESFVHLIDSVFRLNHVRWMSPIERSERGRVERVVRRVGHVDSVRRLQQRQIFSIHTARVQDLQTPRDSSSHWLHAERRDESARRRRERRAWGGGLGSHWIAAGCTGTLLRVSQASLTIPPKSNWPLF